MSLALLAPASGVRWGRARLKCLPAWCAVFMGRRAPFMRLPLVVTSSSTDDSVDLADEIDDGLPEKTPNPEFNEEYLKYLAVMEQKMPDYPPEFPSHLRHRDLSHVINALLLKARDNPAFQHEWDYYPNIMTPRSAREERPGPQQLMWQRFGQRNSFFRICLQQMGAAINNYQTLPSECYNVMRQGAYNTLVVVKKFLMRSIRAILSGLQEDLC